MFEVSMCFLLSAQLPHYLASKTPSSFPTMHLTSVQFALAAAQNNTICSLNQDLLSAPASCKECFACLQCQQPLTPNTEGSRRRTCWSRVGKYFMETWRQVTRDINPCVYINNKYCQTCFCSKHLCTWSLLEFRKHCMHLNTYML